MWGEYSMVPILSSRVLRCAHQGILDELFHRSGQVRDDLSRANPGNGDLVDRDDARLFHGPDHCEPGHTLSLPTKNARQVSVSAVDPVISTGERHSGGGQHKNLPLWCGHHVQHALSQNIPLPDLVRPTISSGTPEVRRFQN